ncbi:MAG TPA: TetR family transcriptional regulator [Candidatus Binatia bacterium]
MKSRVEREVGAGQGAKPRVDGREVRGLRSRDAIVSALLALIAEGHLVPTAQQVAERAGVGLRSVFRHFNDRESLFAAMGERVFASAAPILLSDEPSGTLVERARELVARRAQFFEQIAPYKRSANLRRADSPFIKSRHAELVRGLRADLLRRLPELADARPDELEVLDALTSFETWDRMRSDQGLSREHAHRALEEAVLALVRKAVAGARKAGPGAGSAAAARRSGKGAAAARK